MKLKMWVQWGIAAIRWLSIKLATMLRWASVLVIAGGMGIAVVHYADEGILQSLVLYCALPGALGFFVAHVLDEFGNHQEETCRLSSRRSRVSRDDSGRRDPAPTPECAAASDRCAEMRAAHQVLRQVLLAVDFERHGVRRLDRALFRQRFVGHPAILRPPRRPVSGRSSNARRWRCE